MQLLSWEKGRLDDGRSQLVLRGKLDEHFEPAQLEAAARAEPADRPLVLHLGGIRHVSSVGIREFERCLERLKRERGPVTLVEVSPAIASHLVLLPTLAAAVTVESAQLPYTCPGCGSEKTVTLPYTAGAAAAHAPTCGTCGRKMYLDGVPEQYLPS